MSSVLNVRMRQKKRTIAFPDGRAGLPDGFRGRPRIHKSLCTAGCNLCVAACPTDAIAAGSEGLSIDVGKCLFCGECSGGCPTKAITHTRDYRLAASRREDLILNGDEELRLATALRNELRRVFGRSLKLREVSAGGCNACEAEVNALVNVVFDIGRFGIQFVASPRHADGILVTGCVNRNMLLGLKKTYEAVPDPKVVVAVGACAISGGPFAGTHNGITSILPVDIFIPGCPPHPITLMDGLLRMIGRIR